MTHGRSGKSLAQASGCGMSSNVFTQFNRRVTGNERRWHRAETLSVFPQMKIVSSHHLMLVIVAIFFAQLFCYAANTSARYSSLCSNFMRVLCTYVRFSSFLARHTRTQTLHLFDSKTFCLSSVLAEPARRSSAISICICMSNPVCMPSHTGWRLL